MGCPPAHHRDGTHNYNQWGKYTHTHRGRMKEKKKSGKGNPQKFRCRRNVDATDHKNTTCPTLVAISWHPKLLPSRPVVSPPISWQEFDFSSVHHHVFFFLNSVYLVFCYIGAPLSFITSCRNCLKLCVCVCFSNVGRSLPISNFEMISSSEFVIVAQPITVRRIVIAKRRQPLFSLKHIGQRKWN